MTDEAPRDAVPRAVQACHELLAWLIHLAPTLQRGSQSRRSSVAILLGSFGLLERLAGVPTLERGNENPRT